MKASFQVIRDGQIIFEAFFEGVTPSKLSHLASVGIEKFQMDHPGISLTDEDVIMKWSEWEEPGAEA